MNKLSKLGQEAGVLSETSSEDEIADFVFQAGVTTAEEVSKISGRGIGLEGIRTFLRAKASDISIVFTGESTPDNFRPFKFITRVPKKFTA